MGSHLTLVRCLLAIPGLVLRRDWLQAQLRERPFNDLADEFEALTRDAERLDPEAREALVPLIALLLMQSQSDLSSRLRIHAMATDKTSVLRLLRSYPRPSYFENEEAHPSAARSGKELSLGERKSLARRPERHRFEQLLADPHPQVIRQLLGNPHLTENDVVFLATLRPGRGSTISTLAEFPNWIVRPRVRMALIFSPATPSSIAVPLVALATRPELQEIADSPSLHVVLRATAQELLERHPPLGPASTLTLQ